MRTILHYALNIENTPHSVASYIILTQNEPELFCTLAETPIYRELLTIHFSSHIMPELLSRMATITANFIITLPSKALDYLDNLIFSFLDYTEYYAIISFYRSIMSEYVDCEMVHGWLLKHHLLQEIAKRISSINESFSSSYLYDNYYEKFQGLYNIVHYANSSEIIHDEIANRDLILSLVGCFSSCPPAVNGARWTAITDVLENASSEYVEIFFPMAITVIINATDKPSQDIVAALNFIANTLHISKAIREMVLQGQIFSIALKLVIQFQQSSILQNAFRIFVTNAANYPEFDEKVFRSYLPLFVASAFKDKTSGFARVCRVILFNFTSLAESNPELKIKLNNVEGYQQLYKSDLKDYREVLLSPYGGRIEMFLIPDQV